MIRWLVLLLMIVLPYGPSYAQDQQEIYQPKFEFGLYTGTLLLANIPEVVDNVPPVVLKLGMNSSFGFIEGSLMHARGNDMRWRSGLIDYRFNLDDLGVPFHALFGFHGDMYQVYDGEKEYFGGGWHYGGGAHIEVIPHLYVRADFLNRFGPGRSLLVLVGFSVGVGDAKDTQ